VAKDETRQHYQMATGRGIEHDSSGTGETRDKLSRGGSPHHEGHHQGVPGHGEHGHKHMHEHISGHHHGHHHERKHGRKG
jgi:hypothetical protein